MTIAILSRDVLGNLTNVGGSYPLWKYNDFDIDVKNEIIDNYYKNKVQKNASILIGGNTATDTNFPRFNCKTHVLTHTPDFYFRHKRFQNLNIVESVKYIAEDYIILGGINLVKNNLKNIDTLYVITHPEFLTVSKNILQLTDIFLNKRCIRIRSYIKIDQKNGTKLHVSEWKPKNLFERMGL